LDTIAAVAGCTWSVLEAAFRSLAGTVSVPPCAVSARVADCAAAAALHANHPR